MPRRALIALALSAAAAPSLGAISCRGVTEITVTIDTDAPCASVSGTVVAAMAPDRSEAQTASTPVCNSGEIGTIVLVPSAAIDAKVLVEVKTRLGDGKPETCVDGDKTCIVARRALGFLPHVPLDVRITMHALCAGVRCEAGESCAADGQCHTDDPGDPSFPSEDAAPPPDAPAPPPLEGGLPDVVPPPICGPPTVFDDAIGADPSQLAVTRTAVFWIGATSANAQPILTKPRSADRFLPPMPVPQATNAALLAANDSTLFWYDSVQGAVYSMDLTPGGGPPVRIANAKVLLMSADPQPPNPYYVDGANAYEGGTTLGALGVSVHGLATTANYVYLSANGVILMFQKRSPNQKPTPRWQDPVGRALAWTSLVSADQRNLFWLDKANDVVFTAGEGSTTAPATCPASGAVTIGVNRPSLFLNTPNGLLALPATCAAGGGGNAVPRDKASVAESAYAIVARDDCVYYFAGDRNMPVQKPSLRVISAQP